MAMIHFDFSKNIPYHVYQQLSKETSPICHCVDLYQEKIQVLRLKMTSAEHDSMAGWFETRTSLKAQEMGLGERCWGPLGTPFARRAPLDGIAGFSPSLGDGGNSNGGGDHGDSNNTATVTTRRR